MAIGYKHGCIMRFFLVGLSFADMIDEMRTQREVLLKEI